MISLQKVFVVPAEGVKIPLPVAGMRIPGTGATLARDTHIERLLRTRDLLEGDAATKLAALRQAADAAAKEAAAPPATPPAAEAKPQPAAAKAEK